MNKPNCKKALDLKCPELFGIHLLFHSLIISFTYILLIIFYLLHISIYFGIHSLLAIS